MPFKSQAQRRKFAQLLVEGKISPDTFEEWNRETGAKRLPERVKRKRSAKGTGAAKRKTKRVARGATKRAGGRKRATKRAAKKR
jgi:hypothetical protein